MWLGIWIPLTNYPLIYVHVCEGCGCSGKLLFKEEIRLLNNTFLLQQIIVNLNVVHRENSKPFLKNFSKVFWHRQLCQLAGELNWAFKVVCGSRNFPWRTLNSLNFFAILLCFVIWQSMFVMKSCGGIGFQINSMAAVTFLTNVHFPTSTLKGGWFNLPVNFQCY